MVSSDKPIKDLENDLLDLNNSANILSKLILSSETPLTIGIHGKWGSGKTSLINLAEKTLSKNENIKIIKFNAWKYKGESLRRSFLLNVISELGDEKDEEIRTKLYNSIEEEKLGKIEINWIEIAKETTKAGIKLVIPYLGGMNKILEGVRNILGKKNNENIDDISNLIRKQRYKIKRERMNSLEEFENEFKKLIERSKYETIVIFVDDLDRCLPSNAIDVLEAFKVFFDVEKCIFVVACDVELIETGISEKYLDYEDIGDMYLEKIIQIPFEIPPLKKEKVKEYVKKLDIPKEIKNLSNIISFGVQKNPRKIKRFCNELEVKFSLIRSFGEIDNRELFTKLQCISYTWKKLYKDVVMFWDTDRTNLLCELEKIINIPEDDKKKFIELNPNLEEYINNKELIEFLKTFPSFCNFNLESCIYYTELTEPKKVREKLKREKYEEKTTEILDMSMISNASLDMVNETIKVVDLQKGECPYQEIRLLIDKDPHHQVNNAIRLGFLKRQRGTIKLTELGKKYVLSNKKEKKEILRKNIVMIKIFDILVTRLQLKGQLTKREIASRLKSITEREYTEKSLNENIRIITKWLVDLDFATKERDGTLKLKR